LRSNICGIHVKDFIRQLGCKILNIIWHRRLAGRGPAADTLVGKAETAFRLSF
jgi:hypothetical protein